MQNQNNLRSMDLVLPSINEFSSKEEWAELWKIDTQKKAIETENRKKGINTITFITIKGKYRHICDTYKTIEVHNIKGIFNANQTKEYKELLNEYWNKNQCFFYKNETTYRTPHQFTNTSIGKNEDLNNPCFDGFYDDIYKEFKEAQKNANLLKSYQFKQVNSNVYEW